MVETLVLIERLSADCVSDTEHLLLTLCITLTPTHIKTYCKLLFIHTEEGKKRRNISESVNTEKIYIKL